MLRSRSYSATAIPVRATIRTFARRPVRAMPISWRNRKYRAFNDLRGGGHFSGRLTLTLVAAGVVAKKMIGPIEIRARITELGGIPRERLNCEPGRELGAEGARRSGTS